MARALQLQMLSRTQLRVLILQFPWHQYDGLRSCYWKQLLFHELCLILKNLYSAIFCSEFTFLDYD